MELNLQQLYASGGEAALYSAFEQACINLHNGTGDVRKSAEKVILIIHKITKNNNIQILMQFMNMPSMIVFSRHILEKSANTNVQFQALITLRELIMKQWPNIDDKEKGKKYHRLIKIKKI